MQVMPLLLLLLAAAEPVPASSASPAPSLPPLLAAMSAELTRAHDGLRANDVRPYYVAYEVHEEEQVRLEASWGALVQDTRSKARLLDVDLRVGDHRIDSTHELRGEGGGYRDGGRAIPLPLEDEPLALRQVIWRETDGQFRDAVERLSRVKASLALKAEAEDTSADFSPEEGRVDVRPIPTLEVDRAHWADRLRRVSRLFLASRDVLESTVTLDVGSGARYLASTDGTRLALPDPQARLMIYAATRSDDGMELFRYESWEARSMEGLPDEAAMEAAARKVLEDLQALRAAPVVEPFTGPAILSGSAAAVFFHEIFGHRIEGHRQKSDDEGQTFTKKVGQSVLPPFLSVADDPGQTAYRGVDLMGHYLYDNEGVPGRRAEVVVDGVLRGFLMSRSPVSGFDRSNGHGRRQPGFPPVGRQGNLVVTSRQTLAAAELRARLKELLRKQGKAFGLYFADISGGFTFTNRDAPQAFKVLPIMVYRVFPDDRPDELVRGVDIVGTPLASFSRIVATGGEPEVFNGYCGAESGYIPVSAVAPSILVSEMEIEKRAKGVDRPPILDAPGAEGRR